MRATSQRLVLATKTYRGTLWVRVSRDKNGHVSVSSNLRKGVTDQHLLGGIQAVEDLAQIYWEEGRLGGAEAKRNLNRMLDMLWDRYW